MAIQSDTIYGARRPSTGPRLELKWEVLKQEVGNNRSQVRLTLYLRSQYSLYFSAPKTGNLNGSSFTYRSGFSGTGIRTLSTRTFWVNHNSDGRKSINISASFNIAVTYSGTWVGSLNVSGSISLKDIPRASTLESASISGSLKHNESRSINLKITKKHSSYWHVVYVYDGSTWIADTGFTQDSPTSLTLNSTRVNNILKRMPSSTTKTLKVRLSTYTGNRGSLIGTSSKDITVRISSTEKPEIVSSTIEIAGDGWDKTNGLYIQGISKAIADMRTSAPYGATIASEGITIQGRNYNGNSITSNILNTPGTSKVIYTAVDSRGVSNTTSTNLIVEEYSSPKIGNVEVERTTNESEEANYAVKGTWSDLGGKNKVTLKIRRKSSESSSWIDVIEPQIIAGGILEETGVISGNDISLSHDISVELVDNLGRSTATDATIPTARVLFNFHEDKGIGIGKMHEKGELDVAGDVYFEGDIELAPKPGAGMPGFRMRSLDPSGHGYIEYYGPDDTRRAYIGIPSSTSLDLNIYNEQDGKVRLYGSSIEANGGEVWSDRTVEIKTNSYGSYIKYPNGTLICYATVRAGTGTWTGAASGGFGGKYTQDDFTLPMSFINTSAIVVATAQDGGYRSPWVNRTRLASTSRIRIGLAQVQGSTDSVDVDYIAIGRWK